MGQAIDQGGSEDAEWKDGVALHIHRKGSGPVLYMLHGGMGSWTHWIRNIDVLAERFEVRAIDAPGYGESEIIPYGLSPDEYLDVYEASLRRVIASEERFGFVGFSFGAAISGSMAARFRDQVDRITVIGPGGFSSDGRPPLQTMSYRQADGNPDLWRKTLRHNLLALMLKHPKSVTDDVLDMQDANVRRTRFNSRKVSMQPSLATNLGQAGRPVQLIYGADDVTAWPSIEARAVLIREKFPELALHVIEDTGHWAMFEGADEVNRLITTFHSE